MKKLFLDTSSKKIFITVYNDLNVLSSFCFTASKDVNEKLIENLDFMLNNTGIGIKEIDTFLVAVGPGSFTGIRIGFSFLAGLVLGLNKKLYGITSLDAFALCLEVKKVNLAMKLIGDNYAVKEYDFENNVFGKYLQKKGEEIKNFGNLVVINDDNYNVSNLLSHECAEDFFCAPVPFYIRKSEAEINFENRRCGVD